MFKKFIPLIGLVLLVGCSDITTSNQCCASAESTCCIGKDAKQCPVCAKKMTEKAPAKAAKAKTAAKVAAEK